MALDLRLAKSLSCQGKTFSFSRAATASDGPIGKEPTLAAAKVGSLTTRTNSTAGVLTLDAGHGFANTNIADIYWGSGSTAGVAYKATLSAVNTTSATFSAAGVKTADGGDVLPVVNTAVTAMVVNSETFNVVAAELQALAVYAGGVPCVARFVDSGGNDVATVVVTPGNEGYVWFTDDDSGSASPLGSNTATVKLTHGSSGGSVAVSSYAYMA